MNLRPALPRPCTGPLTRLLRVMALLAGVFVMHGLQVTSGPTEMLGVPGTPVAFATVAHTVSHAHSAPATPATRTEDTATADAAWLGADATGTRTTGTRTTAAAATAEQAHSGGSEPCGNCDGHGHPGGQVCLGLLALGSIIAFLVSVLWRRAVGTESLVRAVRFVRPLSGRPSPRPDIYRLAVLLQ